MKDTVDSLKILLFCKFFSTHETTFCEAWTLLQSIIDEIHEIEWLRMNGRYTQIREINP